MNKKLYGDAHVEVADSLAELAEILLIRGQKADAERLQTEADEIRARLAENKPK